MRKQGSDVGHPPRQRGGSFDSVAPRFRGRGGSVQATTALLKQRGLLKVDSNNGETPWYIIDPRSSRYLAMWDSSTVIALLFTAIVT
eukprot:6410403-Prymnesium_polylepis.3